MLQNGSGIKTTIETPLKSGDEGAILRSPEDAEQRLAEARANRQQRNPVKMVPHHKSNRNQGTSTQPGDKQKELDAHNAEERQEPRNVAKSLQKEELSIHSQSDKTKSNENPVFSKT